MKIGLIDVDGHNFPNLPLMKISAYHKQQGDSVEWYEPLWSGHMDKVYVSKVFSNTPDYQYYINADKVIKGGSGYAISLVNGKKCMTSQKMEVFQRRLKPYIRIIRYIMIYFRKSKILHMDFLLEAVREVVIFAMLRVKRGNAPLRLPI